ncbi:hypothetical protein Pyn_22441 [Prunus yedoensis var. nudiflora]|uniref:Uncharacterized protein n=1 Tax=Prunus yedoensis var. nudiflora TaxID=2094558 RepID=A0A314ZCS9_PRUYE|nr:hypothetical protein Pyn_22441 [Prunus yedoensis var. nudiflora]
MATKPFTGSSRTLSETQTELPQKETETVLPQKETESELPQNRTSEAENSNNQTWNIRKNVITAAEKSRNVGIFDFSNEYHEGGAVDHHQGGKGQNKTDYNIDGNKIDSKEGEFVGIGKFGNKYYNSRKEEGTSKKPWCKFW